MPHDGLSQPNRAHQQALVKPRDWATTGRPTTRLDEQGAIHAFSRFSASTGFAGSGRCGYCSLWGFKGRFPAVHAYSSNHLGERKEARLQAEREPSKITRDTQQLLVSRIRFQPCCT